jgi:diguanylate cyclase (GGDEF)-like protein/PAS domain S-box-containing protein
MVYGFGLMSQFRRESLGRERGGPRGQVRRLRALLTNASALSLIMSPDTTITYVATERPLASGQLPSALLGRMGLDLVHPDDRVRAMVAFEEALASPGPHAPFVVRVLDHHSEPLFVEAHLTNAMEDPDVGGVAASFVDVTHRRRAEERLEQLALEDPLTGLANRALLADRMVQAAARSASRGASVALILLDVRDLATVNARFGHSAGDALLRTVAERVSRVSAVGDTVARLTSSQFVVLREGVERPYQVLRLARALLAAVNRPVPIDGEAWPLSVNAGATMSAQPDLDRILREADLALATARHRGRGQIDVFTPGHAEQASLRLAILEGIRRPHITEDLSVVYQPFVDLETCEPVGAEALLRWNHPIRGHVPPALFIPLAESTGAIQHIGRWVLRTACAQAASWPAGPHGPIDLAVNVSARQLAADHFVEDVLLATGFTEFDPRRLILEITETAVVDDPSAARRNLAMLADCGIRIAIDDFGTGHGTLTYLRQLPVHVIKIDRSFVSGLGTHAQDTAIVAGVISLSRSLGTAVTAEGVETQEQRQALSELGCRLGQGWLFSRPLHEPAFQEYLRTSPQQRPG